MAGRDSIHRRLSFLLPRALWKPFCKLYLFNHSAVFNFTVGVSLMIRNGLSSAARFFLRYFKMRVWVRLSCAVGNVFNDFYRQLLQSFELLFFMKVVELSASEAGLIILIGEIADALFSPITGYLGDLASKLTVSFKEDWQAKILASFGNSRHGRSTSSFVQSVLSLCWQPSKLASPILLRILLGVGKHMFQHGRDKSHGFHHSCCRVCRRVHNSWRT